MTHDPRLQSNRPSAVEMAINLTDWMGSPLGQALLDAERRALAPVLSRVFGYHVLQLSCAPDIDMLADCLVCHKIGFAPAWVPGRKLAVADIESLPLETDSVDAVLLHHALDFTQDSHRLLREATRVLMPGGRLLILGFNPASLWGLGKILRYRKRTPWDGRFLSRRRIADWLSLLDFRVDKVSYGGFFPPVSSPGILARSKDFDHWLERFGNPTGAFYLIVASKQRVPLIPVASRWRKLRTPAIGVPLADTGRVAADAARVSADTNKVVILRPRQKHLKDAD
jgi:SAM-dependent methyltransferase